MAMAPGLRQKDDCDAHAQHEEGRYGPDEWVLDLQVHCERSQHEYRYNGGGRKHDLRIPDAGEQQDRCRNLEAPTM